jgi:hypothetical protein
VPDDASFRALTSAGLHDDGARTLERYQELLAGALQQVGLEVREVAADHRGWDEERGRGPGHPTEDVVERARGDRNRALLLV